MAHVKRLIERCLADPSFCNLLKKDPKGSAALYGIKLDPEDVRPIWDKNVEHSSGLYPLIEEYKQFYKQELTCPEYSLLAESIKNLRFRIWRLRQIARTTMQFNKRIHETILIHIPLAFELSWGCSGKCWFCSLAASPLKDIFRYTKENKTLWREVLLTLKDSLGKEASAAICYWATEPFDNPDYEKFLQDFHEIFDFYPQTTTAMPLRDIARTKRFLKVSREKGCKFNRFSVNSLRQLDNIYNAFDPEELRYVKLVFHNPESETFITNSGRAREPNINNKRLNGLKYIDGTTACVSGFLINMVEQSIKLVSPCRADDRWPLGYMTYDEAVFSDARDLGNIIEDMMERYMPVSFRDDDIVRFRRDLVFKELDDGFEVSTRFMKRSFQNDPHLRIIGLMIKEANKTLKEIVELSVFLGISPQYISNSIDLMFQNGVLDEGP
jgi:radical SAM family RiPP maturation amino acid epimerase